MPEIIEIKALNNSESKSPAIIMVDSKVCSKAITLYRIATINKKQMLQITATFTKPGYRIT
jgi:hypothetical protein